MEEKKIQEIFDALKNEALSERERFVMRKQLELLMMDHPLKVPFHIRMAERLAAFDTAAFNYVGSHSIATAALAFVLVVGVGTSYAAGGALPGDALYAVKIQVNEKFEGALAVSNVAKVQWSSTQIERRLEEAEVLAAKGTLNDEKSSVIAAQIEASTNNFDTHIAILAGTANGEEAATDAESDFDASISAHEQLLAKIGNKVPHVKPAITPILSTVRARVNTKLTKGNTDPTLMMAMTATTANDTVASARKASTGGKEAATRQKQRAQKKLQEVRDLTKGAKATLGTRSYTYFHSEASSTEQNISAGDKKADEGDFDQAIQSYQEAIKVSAEAKAGLNAEIHLRQNVNLLNFDLNSSDDESEKGEVDPTTSEGKGILSL